MTLNKIIQRLQEIVEAHEQINTFFFGDIDDFLKVDRVYPACFLGKPSETIIANNTLIRFSLFFFDREIIGGSESDKTLNTTEVLSDMREIALDIFSQIRYQKFSPIWNVEKDATLEYYNEDKEDYLAGVKLDVIIKLPFNTDRCQVPTIYTY